LLTDMSIRKAEWWSLGNDGFIKHHDNGSCTT
jgi:hypothetical protein